MTMDSKDLIRHHPEHREPYVVVKGRPAPGTSRVIVAAIIEETFGEGASEQPPTENTQASE